MSQGADEPPGGAMPGAPPEAADGNPDLVRALNLGVSHFRAGRLAESKAVYEEILRNHPGSAASRHFLGLIAHAQGDHERAIELLEEAIAQVGTIAFFHGNLAEIYRSLGRNEAAVAACERALELIPVYPEALNTWGAVLYEAGELDAAEAKLRRAVEFKPDLAEAHANLGNVHRARGLHDKAVKAYERALRHNPRLVGARMALGDALRTQGRPEDAVACYRQALDSHPKDAKIWSNLGTALRGLERNDEALESFRHAVRLQPGLAEAQMNLGTCHLVLGDLEGALDSYRTAFALKRTPSWGKPEAEKRRRRLAETMDPRFQTTTLGKLRHDIAQFRYLAKRGRLPKNFEAEIGRYEAVLGELEAAPGGKRIVGLTLAQRDLIADTYNKAVHVADTGALEGDPLDPALDAGALQRNGQAAGIAWVDGLLTPEALEALRRYCLESTIWFDFTDEDGRLGAQMTDGFDCALLLRIAEGLRQRFPDVLGDSRLRHIRACDHGQRMEAGHLRADAAAVNATFWITPDAANLDPEGGGLRIHTRPAPADLQRIARDQEAIRAFLEGSDSVTVAYRQNRAVLFDAALFHGTETVRFAEGFENRRIGVTMLFGERGAGGGSAPAG